MTGPFDDGVRLGDAPMSVEQRAAGDAKIRHLLAFAEFMVGRSRMTELCRARWGEIDSLFRCRCKRDRLVPHVCECICRPRRP